MNLSRNSFAHLKTGMASPTIALAAPTASMCDQDERDDRVDWKRCWEHGGAVQAVVGPGVNRVMCRVIWPVSSQTPREDGGTVGIKYMLHAPAEILAGSKWGVHIIHCT